MISTGIRSLNNSVPSSMMNVLNLPEIQDVLNNYVNDQNPYNRNLLLNAFTAAGVSNKFTRDRMLSAVLRMERWGAKNSNRAIRRKGNQRG